MIRSRARSSLLLVTSILAVLTTLPVTGTAAVGRKVCRAEGTLHYRITDPNKRYLAWSLQGQGSCFDQAGRRYEVTFAGTNPDEGGVGVPQCPISFTDEWRISVSLSLRDKRSGVITNRDQLWVGMLRDPETGLSGGHRTTYPIVTTFGVVPYVDPLFLVPSGAGAIFSRIGGRCPPEGTDKASFVWQFPA
jgi:hypothetical protein